jgi:hypothetical protein
VVFYPKKGGLLFILCNTGIKNYGVIIFILKANAHLKDAIFYKREAFQFNIVGINRNI